MRGGRKYAGGGETAGVMECEDASGAPADASGAPKADASGAPADYAGGAADGDGPKKPKKITGEERSEDGQAIVSHKVIDRATEPFEQDTTIKRYANQFNEAAYQAVKTAVGEQAAQATVSHLLSGQRAAHEERIMLRCTLIALIIFFIVLIILWGSKKPSAFWLTIVGMGFIAGGAIHAWTKTKADQKNIKAELEDKHYKEKGEVEMTATADGKEGSSAEEAEEEAA